MTGWIKVYNSMPQHPKLLAVGERAAWLQVCGLCYSNEHLTDGFIPRHALPVVAPGVKGAERLAQSLVSIGLWHETDGGWQIHDYDEHQRSAEEIRERRARDAARKAASRSTRSPRGHLAAVRAESASLEVEVEEKREANASSPAASVGRERAKASDEDRANCRLFAELVRQRNTKAKIPPAGTPAHDGWYRDMRRLRETDGNAADEIAQAIRWVFTDPSEDAAFWGTTIQAPSGLREHFAQVWAKMIHKRTGRNSQTVESSAAFLARRGAA